MRQGRRCGCAFPLQFCRPLYGAREAQGFSSCIIRCCCCAGLGPWEWGEKCKGQASWLGGEQLSMLTSLPLLGGGSKPIIQVFVHPQWPSLHREGWAGAGVWGGEEEKGVLPEASALTADKGERDQRCHLDYPNSL